MTSMTFSAPAKLNLFLHILARRSDGYHELQTIFQYLDFGDTLKFEVRQDAEIHIDPQITFLKENNLIWKAANILQLLSKNKLGVDIQIEKRIPMGAGLGGGSSDAATVLLVLNHLWQLDLSLETLMAIGEILGADVPFFIQGKASWGQGIGTHLTPVDLEEPWYVVLIPDCHISSKELYMHPDLLRSMSAMNMEDALVKLDTLENSFQTLAMRLYPEVAEAIEWLNQKGRARLTGSGSAVFAAFKNKAIAQKVLQQKPATLKGFIAKGMNRSPLMVELDKVFF